ncbi:MAG: glycoside hydrolase family 31 protein [Bacilli bacterium]
MNEEVDKKEKEVSKAKTLDAYIIKGNKYRFSVLSERLIRLEYNETGLFLDYPTILASNRNFDMPKFEIKEDNTFLEIKTAYFTLSYVKNKKFSANKFTPMANLKVTLKDTEKFWYYNHPEARNYGGSNVSIDYIKDNFKLDKGLYSLDGFVSINDSNNYYILEDNTLKKSTNIIDIYLFMYDKDFALALNDYYKLTSFPLLIPRYALGVWWCKNTNYTDIELEKLITEFKENDTPLSVLLLDKDWHIRELLGYKKLSSGFSFNKDLIKEPVKLIDYVHKNNIKIGLQTNIKDGIFPFEENYELIKQAFDIEGNKIIKLDLLNKKVLDVYMNLLIKPLEDLGIDFFWNDYDDFNNIDTLKVINFYHDLNAGKNPLKREMLLARNSLSASQRNSILYSGETITSWNTLKYLPTFNMSAANIGLSWWSHDIGGSYGGIEEDELYLRSVEFGTFSPIFRLHESRGKYYKRLPWEWNINTKTIANYYLDLRNKLIPYIYTEGYNYHKTGLPLVRPLYYQLPFIYDDTTFKNEYLFGRNFLVSPILDKMDVIMKRTVHKFYLPEGTWYDFKTGKKYNGSKSYVAFFKQEDYPVFVKSGAIIPLTNDLGINNPTNLEIQIFPGLSNIYNLYEDDNVTSLYKEEYNLITQIDYNYQPNNYTVIMRSLSGKKGLVPNLRNYKFVFRNTKLSSDVIIHFNEDIIPINKMYVEKNDFIVEVNNVPSIGQLTVNCKGKDIEIDAVRLINEDIEEILSDLQIETFMKEKIAAIIFTDLPIKKKRIEIRKLRAKGLRKEHVRLFLKLLEYIDNF